MHESTGLGLAAMAWGAAAALAVVSTATGDSYTIPWLIFMVTVAATATLCVAIERAKEKMMQEVRDEFNCVGPVSDDSRRLTSL